MHLFDIHLVNDTKAFYACILQILMSVLMEQVSVHRSVTILWVHSCVIVTADLSLMLIEGHAMVRDMQYIILMSIIKVCF